MTKTAHEKLLKKISQLLNKLEVDYFVTGGFAVSVWGRPRATFDIDILVKMEGVNITVFVDRLKKISEENYIDEDMVREEVNRKREFNFIDSNTGVKVDFFVLGESEWSKKKMERKVVKNIGGTDINFISPEDLVLSKLKWYELTESDRHLRDARSVLKISKDKINKKYLNFWAKKMELSSYLKGIN